MIKAPTLFAAVVLVAVLSLSACHGSQPDKQVQAQGEILPGSVSDTMLPLDTVTSQPPLAPRAEKGPASAASDSPDVAAAGADAAPADAAKPAG